MRTDGPGQSALLLLDVVTLLASADVDYAVIGAMAASVHGVVRASVDADALLSADAQQLRDLEQKFAAAGFQTQLRRGDLDDPIPAVLALKDLYGNSVDLLAGLRGLEPMAFARAISIPFQGQSLRVIGREDFIAMKVFAGGPKDVMDARLAIGVAGEALDLPLVRQLAWRYGRSSLDTLEKLLEEKNS